jgi:hypothetical protein
MPSGPKAMPDDDDEFIDKITKIVETMPPSSKKLFEDKYMPPDGKPKTNDEDPQFTSIEQSNKWYCERFVVVVDNGATQIIRRHKDGRLIPFRKEGDFFSAYAHKNFVSISAETGNPTTIYSAKKWFTSPERGRVTFYETTFDPKNAAPPHVFNYWPGFGTQSIKGDCRIIVRFIYIVICSKDKKAFKYIVRWCAHLVQRPWEKPEIAIVLIGPKGVGKSQFSILLERLVDGLRKYVLTHKTVRETDITDKFNDHLKNKLLLNWTRHLTLAIPEC